MLAIINAHYDVAALLLDKGANPNLADSSGMAALYAAVDMHTLDETPGRPAPKSTDKLTALGPDEGAARRAAPTRTRSWPPRCIERVHNNGDGALGAGATPLMRAAKKGDIAAMRVLLDHGADVNVAMKSGATVLMFVSGRGGLGRFGVYDMQAGHAMRTSSKARSSACSTARTSTPQTKRGRRRCTMPPSARRRVHRVSGRQRRPAGREGQAGPAAARPRAGRRRTRAADRARERRGDFAEADELQ